MATEVILHKAEKYAFSMQHLSEDDRRFFMQNFAESLPVGTPGLGRIAILRISHSTIRIPFRGTPASTEQAGAVHKKYMFSGCFGTEYFPAFFVAALTVLSVSKFLQAFPVFRFAEFFQYIPLDLTYPLP